VSALEEAIQVIRLMWSGEHGIRFDGKFYQLAGAHSGPSQPPDRDLARGLQTANAVADRPSGGRMGAILGPLKAPDLLAGNQRIDEAALAAGRDPRSIRRVLNAGYLDAKTLVALAVDYGMDTFLSRRIPTRCGPSLRRSRESS